MFISYKQNQELRARVELEDVREHEEEVSHVHMQSFTSLTQNKTKTLHCDPVQSPFFLSLPPPSTIANLSNESVNLQN